MKMFSINLLKVRLMKNKLKKRLKKVFVISAVIWHVTDFNTKAGLL